MFDFAEFFAHQLITPRSKYTPFNSPYFEECILLSVSTGHANSHGAIDIKQIWSNRGILCPCRKTFYPFFSSIRRSFLASSFFISTLLCRSFSRSLGSSFGPSVNFSKWVSFSILLQPTRLSQGVRVYDLVLLFPIFVGFFSFTSFFFHFSL